MKEYRLFLSLGGALIASCALTSCDNEYDLSKNINTDMKVGEYFSIPVGKTTNVELSRIIKESNSIKPNEQFTYEVITSGSTSSSIDLDAVSVNITPYIGVADIDISNISPFGTPQLKASNVSLPGLYIESEPYNVNTKLPKEVETIYRANLSNSQTHLTLSIDEQDWPNGIDKITLTNFKAKFPKILESEQGSSSFTYPKEIIFTSSQKSQDVPILFNAIDISAEEQSQYIVGQSGNKHLRLNERLSITADVNVKISGMPSATKVPIHFSYSTDGPVIISDVSGVFHTSANINEVITMNDIPDFLRNGNSSFAPEEVNFHLSLDNPINIPWQLSLDFQSSKGDTQKSEIVQVPISVDPGYNSYIISNTANADIAVENLPVLFSFIPDNFSITSPNDIKLSSENYSQTIELGRSYNINAKYDVSIPFSFSDMAIEYTDEIDGLLSDLSDVLDKVDTNELLVTATAESTIPAQLKASVKLFDMAGNSLDDGIEVNLEECTIEGADVNDNSSPKASPLKITLTQTKIGYLKRLERIEYTVNAVEANPSVSLRSNQYLCIKNITVKIPNGLKVTL